MQGGRPGVVSGSSVAENVDEMGELVCGRVARGSDRVECPAGFSWLTIDEMNANPSLNGDHAQRMGDNVVKFLSHAEPFIRRLKVRGLDGCDTTRDRCFHSVLLLSPAATKHPAKSECSAEEEWADQRGRCHDHRAGYQQHRVERGGHRDCAPRHAKRCVSRNAKKGNHYCKEGDAVSMSIKFER